MSNKSLADRLLSCYSGAVYDALREIDETNTVLPSDIRPLEQSSVVAGPISTLSGGRVDGASADETLLAWTGFLSDVPGEHVVVCQPSDDTLAHMGELSGEVLKRRGVLGYIVDGGCRDSTYLSDIGFPVFARYLTPKDIVGRWMVDSIDVEIEIGGVTIRPGDYVIADRDGVVCIPKKVVNQVVDRAEELMTTETDLRKALRDGEDPRAAYLEYRVF